VKAVEELLTIDRAGVRQVFEERFSVARMTDDYESVYERVVRVAEETKGLPGRASWDLALLP
jgi:hypothetical protein